MADHDAAAALPESGDVDKELLRALLYKRMSYNLTAAEDSRNIVAVDPWTGATIITFVQNGHVYAYDAGDTTTAHDGVVCLVSSEGRRYKLDDLSKPYSVLDKDLTAPPVSPSLGDAYLIYGSPTGDWAGESGKIAIYTAREWEFAAAPIGLTLYAEDELAFYHKDANGDWQAGLGSLILGSASVRPSSLIGRPVRWHIENQTTNAPPGTAAVGVAYIVGPSPTGAWSGHAGEIAICEVEDTFTLYAPRTGELAYDKALAKDIRYSGSSWVAGADACVLIETKSASGDATIDFLLSAAVTAEFDVFEVRISSAKPATDDVEMRLRIGTGATPTYQSSSYHYQGNYASSAAGASALASTSSGHILCSSSVTGDKVGNGAGKAYNATIRFNNPEASDNCEFRVESYYAGAGGASVTHWGGGRYNSAVAVTALRFLFSSGNIASGRFSLYGYRKA